MPAVPGSLSVAPGDILAEKYRVLNVLGAGGMGVVVAAEHIELQEKVAIKFLLDEASENSELSERFLREARAAVRIRSEHVVRVIDVGKLPSGAPYMVMEYLEGEDLSETVERGPLPIADAVDYVIQACEAMSVAHGEGIVHRDLKPANLFLSKRPDGSPIVKVLDFGISKLTTTQESLSLTHTQATMGSPLYMSPEQMRSSKNVSRSADIWSLGVILYELLAGDVPFSGQTYPEVLVKVMGDEPRPLRALRGEVPLGLELLVQQCLSKAPESRPQSAAALAVALSAFASHRTAGLQNRLRRSLSEPALAPVALEGTRVEAGGAAPLGSGESAAGAGPGASGSAANGASLATNTAWEEEAAGLPARRPGRLWMGAGLFAVAAAMAVVMTLRGSGEASPAAAGAAEGGEPLPPGSALAAPPPASAVSRPVGAPAALKAEVAETDAPSTEALAAAAAARAEAVEEPRAAGAAPGVGRQASARKGAEPRKAAEPRKGAQPSRPSRRTSAPRAAKRSPSRHRAAAAVRSARAEGKPAKASAPPPAAKAPVERPRSLSIDFK